MISSGMHNNIMTKVLDEMGAERSDNFKPPLGWNDGEWSLYLNHVNAAQVHVYKQWVNDGRTVPINRMVSLGVRLVCNGANLEKTWQTSSEAVSA